jgi:flagellar L-ring protein FlgH
MKTLPLFAGVFAVIVVSGCTTTPPTRIAQPMTVRPAEPSSMPAMNGSIYQAGLSRPLFEDRRARYIGDILTINIVENNTASSKSDASASRSNSITAKVGNPMDGVPGRMFEGLNLSTSSANNMAGKGAADNTNVFKGTITVTVTEVLPNGNLIVSGEKLVAIGPGDEYVRLSGVVNPSNISGSNMVDSSKIADARIEYKSAGYINESMQMPWLARFFLNVLPF